MQMIKLFFEYKDASKISEALLVGKNMVNKNPGNYEMFQAYVGLLFSLAEKLPSLPERKEFAGQAEIALAFFEENADLSPDIIMAINRYKQKLADAMKSIRDEEGRRADEALQEIQAGNNEQLKSLYMLKKKLAEARTRNEFEGVLQEISLTDAKIDHDYITAEQKAHYDQINKDCTACISDKMREIEHWENMSYNKKAVEAYSEAFRKFKENEGKYKNLTQLYSLVSSTLFAYDAARLFNETLIYYNHVYSYIFSKLDDNGKLDLTRLSIECERKQR